MVPLERVVSSRRVRRLVCAYLLTCAPLAAHAQERLSPRLVLSDYRADIAQYRHGDAVDSLRHLLSHGRPWVAVAVEALARSADASTEDLQAAVLMHTEAATGGWVHNDDAVLQLSAAKQFIDLRRGGNSTFRLPADFRRNWHLVVAWCLQRELQYPTLIGHLDTALARYRDDPELLLAQGTFYEIFGWSEKPPGDWVIVAPRLLTSATRTRRGLLLEAERALRRALLGAPALEEARLRLGHVLTELGRPDEAVAMLKPLQSTDQTLPFAYLATLFVGAALERLHHLDQAATAYQQAASLRPQCQTPWVALSAVLRAKGEDDASYGMLLRTAAAGTRCADPWWDYKYGQWAWRLEATLDAMRAQVQ